MAQAEAGFQQSFPTTVDLPLVGVPLQRGTGTGDQRYVNTLFEVYTNPITGGKSAYVIKRPGLANHTQPPAGAATGRGLYAWEGSGKIYSVFGNKIYADGSDMGVTLAGTSGRVWFAESGPTSNARILVISDGTDTYHIETDDTIVTIDENDDAQFPQNNVGSIVFFDDYFFLAQEDGEIWNTEVDTFTGSTVSYVATALEDANARGDELVAIALQKDQLIAFGKFSIEFYFDNGTVPSPLLRHAENIIQMGLADKNLLQQAGDIIFFVAEAPSQGRGGRSVWMMEGLTKIRKVSTPVIERFLNAEGSSISSCTSFAEEWNGHLLFGVNFSTANRSFIYDASTDMWQEWEHRDGSAKFNCMAATSKNGTVYLQDATNGRIYTLSGSTYQDSGSTFTVTIQTDNYDFGTPLTKFQSGFWIMGDITTGTISVSETDDDYANFHAARTIDMTATRKFLPEGGAFFQRAYKLTYAQNAALRLQKLSIKIEVGDG